MYPNQPAGQRSVSGIGDQPDRTNLMIRRCAECGKLLAPQISTCSSCRSATLEWVSSSGEGSIVSWKVVHRPAAGVSGQWETFTMAIVELDEGPWVYATIEGEIPAPSSLPVRVRFEPTPNSDRFPVFTTDLVDRRYSIGTGEFDGRLATDRKPMVTTIQDNADDEVWVRSLLHLCDSLSASKSLDTDARSVVTFAIRSAPSGGASAGELLADFGVSRWRFMLMIREALRPRACDSRNTRASKRNLLDTLSWAWRVYPDRSALLSTGA
jgi:uncharacterized OB-fold protein